MQWPVGSALGISMIYGVTTKGTSFTEGSLNNWRARLVKAVLFFVPRANPDVERFYPLVKEWALELSDDGWPQREVGLDKTGRPLFATPYGRNLGFWIDMARQQFQRGELRQISAEEFEQLWLHAFENASPFVREGARVKSVRGQDEVKRNPGGF